MDVLTRVLFDRIAKEITSRSKIIVESKATSLEDYKAKCAYVQALADVMSWGTEIADRANRNFEEPPSPIQEMRARMSGGDISRSSRRT